VETQRLAPATGHRHRNWHYWISLLLATALAPALRSQHLPLKFDWMTLGIAYWIVLAAESIFVATLLCLIGLPRETTWQPLLARYRQTPVRIVLVIIYFALLFWGTTAFKALILTIDTVAILELRERRRSEKSGQIVAAVFVPAAYLFFGFLVVLAFNSAIVSARFNFANDHLFGMIDKWLMHGHSISEIAHWAVGTFSLRFFRGLEFVYFGMFPQIGAAMIILALCDGKARALQFVGTILVSYYLALALFYFWPSQGPYYLCPDHFARFPASLQAFSIQKTLIAHAMARWRHEPMARISTDYFIGLPCMHVAQPMIVLWFLRRWRRMVITLAAYDLLLVAAIIFLEWHYLVDILAGILVAAVAILISGRGSLVASASLATAGDRA
jgi:hypothetical protein